MKKTSKKVTVIRGQSLPSIMIPDNNSLMKHYNNYRKNGKVLKNRKLFILFRNLRSSLNSSDTFQPRQYTLHHRYRCRARNNSSSCKG